MNVTSSRRIKRSWEVRKRWEMGDYNFLLHEPDRDEIDRLMVRGRLLRPPTEVLKITKYRPNKTKNDGMGAYFCKLPDGELDKFTVLGLENFELVRKALAAHGYQLRSYEVSEKLRPTLSEPFGATVVVEKGTVAPISDEERAGVLREMRYKATRACRCIDCGTHTGSTFPQKRRCDRCNRKIETERVRRGRAEGRYK